MIRWNGYHETSARPQYQPRFIHPSFMLSSVRELPHYFDFEAEGDPLAPSPGTMLLPVIVLLVSLLFNPVGCDRFIGMESLILRR